VNYVYKKFDINLSGSAASISTTGSSIDFSDAKAGDLVFFKKSGRIFHVSIIEKFNSGELWVIHSTSSKGVIKEDVLASPYWKTKLDKIISLSQISQQH
jgi:cell wall-associated NlpC family hydrolase